MQPHGLAHGLREAARQKRAAHLFVAVIDAGAGAILRRRAQQVTDVVHERGGHEGARSPRLLGDCRRLQGVFGERDRLPEVGPGSALAVERKDALDSRAHGFFSSSSFFFRYSSYSFLSAGSRGLG